MVVRGPLRWRHALGGAGLPHAQRRLLLEPSLEETTAAFYRKHFKRIGPVILFWSLFYLFWGRFIDHEPRTLRSVVRDLVLGEPYYHLHFLFALPGLYFLTPMLRVYIRHAPARQFQLLTSATVSVTLLAGLIHELRGRAVGESLNAFTRFIPFLGFFLLGYCLRGVVLSRRGRIGVLAAFIASVVLYAAGTAWLAGRFPSHPFALYFLSQHSLTRLTGGVCVFLLMASLLHHGIRTPAINWMISRLLAPASLGVYLVHPIFIDVLRDSHSSLMNGPTWVSLPLATLAIWAASVTTTLLFRRLPLLRRLVG